MQCVNGAVGTYYVDVPTYLQAYFSQAYDNAQNEGVDYTEPNSAQYVGCSQMDISNRAVSAGTNAVIPHYCGNLSFNIRILSHLLAPPFDPHRSSCPCR